MRTIPFGKPMIGDAERAAVQEVLQGPILVHGPKSKQFEADFAAFTGAPFAVSNSSCTAALHLSYFHWGIGPGDEVIVPAQTHNATAHAVELCGAKPVFVDAERITGNIDIDAIESAITERTKAISVVHFLGLPVDMERVCSIAEKHSLYVVEDCAIAIGSRLKGKHVGLFGDTGCYSFYPVKHMTTSEGGMLITKHEDLAAQITRKRAFGVDRTALERTVPGIYDVTMLGFNYRMSEIEAALGIEQVKRLPDFLEKRAANFKTLSDAVGEIEEVESLRSSHGDFESSYYCFSALLKDKVMPKRFEIVSHLKQNGVGTSVYYPRPVPHFTYYKEKYGYLESTFPVARWISDSSISLSVGPHLNEEDMLYTAEQLKNAISKEK